METLKPDDKPEWDTNSQHYWKDIFAKTGGGCRRGTRSKNLSEWCCPKLSNDEEIYLRAIPASWKVGDHLRKISSDICRCFAATKVLSPNHPHIFFLLVVIYNGASDHFRLEYYVGGAAMNMNPALTITVPCQRWYFDPLFSLNIRRRVNELN